MPKGAQSKKKIHIDQPPLDEQKKKRNNKPSFLQKEALVSFMERHTNFATGRINSGNARLKWGCLVQMLGEEVNAVDDCNKRDGALWWKCWLGLRAHAKEFSASNARRNLPTGGGGPGDFSIDSMMDENELAERLANEELTTGDHWVDRIMRIMGWNIALGTGLSDDLETTEENIKSAALHKGKSAAVSSIFKGKENARTMPRASTSSTATTPLGRKVDNILADNSSLKRKSSGPEATSPITINSSSDSTSDSMHSLSSRLSSGSPVWRSQNDVAAKANEKPGFSCKTAVFDEKRSDQSNYSDSHHMHERENPDDRSSKIHRSAHSTNVRKPRPRPYSECMSNFSSEESSHLHNRGPIHSSLSNLFNFDQQPSYSKQSLNGSSEGSSQSSGHISPDVQPTCLSQQRGASTTSIPNDLHGSPREVSESSKETSLRSPSPHFQLQPMHASTPRLSPHSLGYHSASVETQTSEHHSLSTDAVMELIWSNKRTAESLERTAVALNNMMDFMSKNIATIVLAPKEEIVTQPKPDEGVTDRKESSMQHSEPVTICDGVVQAPAEESVNVESNLQHSGSAPICNAVPQAPANNAVGMDMPDLSDLFAQPATNNFNSDFQELVKQLNIEYLP